SLCSSSTSRRSWLSESSLSVGWREEMWPWPICERRAIGTGSGRGSYLESGVGKVPSSSPPASSPTALIGSGSSMNLNEGGPQARKAVPFEIALPGANFLDRQGVALGRLFECQGTAA